MTKCTFFVIFHLIFSFAGSFIICNLKIKIRKMHIANPIYDVVFKYLMEDAKIAKLMISTIIGEEILELDFCSQEFVGEFEAKQQSSKSGTKTKVKSKKRRGTDKLKARLGLTVYRLDFTAKIKTKEGYKRVIFELQKAKFPTDIMRFRKYLGDQLSNKENTERVLVNGKSRKFGLPIISIYFLGHPLDHTKSSAIKVSRQYIDLITNELKRWPMTVLMKKSSP